MLLSAGAAGLAAFGSPPAAAQQSATADEKLELVVVTGSRIARAEIESTAPLTVVSFEDIERTGLNNLGDVLYNLASSDGTALRPITTATNGSDGSSQVSLRNLGAARTLILVNGHRWVTDGNGTVDLNTIPTAMIERVEVLKDGASALYGSDAIAGVINVILRKKFEGIQFSGNIGETQKGDGRQEAYSVLMGASSEKSSGVLGLSYAAQDPIFAKDREISKTPIFGCTDPPQNTLFGSYCGSASNALGRFTVGSTSYSLKPGAAGSATSDFKIFQDQDRYNFSPVNYLQQPVARYNLFSNATTELSDGVEAYASLVYTKIQAEQQLAEVPATPSVAGANGPQWTIGISPNNVFNPFKQQIDSWGYRFVSVGPRNPTYDYDIYGVNLGLKGNFEMGGSQIVWNVGGVYNTAGYDRVGNNYINLFNLRNAVGPSFRDAQGTLRCGTPTSIIAGCVPFNVFGGPDLGVAKGVITAAEAKAMNNYVGYTQVATAGLDSQNWYADVSSELFELPAGPLGVALGVEYRKSTYFSQPDTLVASGGSSDNFSEPTRGSTTVTEFFGEISIPVFADALFAKELTFTVANRWADYDGEGKVGQNTVAIAPGKPSTYKAGLIWRPIDDVMIRGTIGETFRAPSVTNLFGGKGESFPVATDPCQKSRWAAATAGTKEACKAAGVLEGGSVQLNSQLRTLNGGNTNLIPEEGENWTAGIVYTPSFVPNLSVAIDYWDIQLDKAISGFSASTILNRCYVLLQSEFCPLVERVTVDGSGQISAVNTTSFNASQRVANGIDFSVRYALETERFGRFSWQWDTTKAKKDASKLIDAASFTNQIGYYGGEVAWKYRSNLVTNWQYRDFSVSWTMRYTSALIGYCVYYTGLGGAAGSGKDINGTPIACNRPNDLGAAYFYGATNTNRFGVNRFPAVVYHDLQVAYKTPWSGVLSVGARNLTGKEPTVTDQSFANSFDYAYDVPGGRYMYLSYSQKL